MADLTSPTVGMQVASELLLSMQAYVPAVPLTFAISRGSRCTYTFGFCRVTGNFHAACMKLYDFADKVGYHTSSKICQSSVTNIQVTVSIFIKHHGLLCTHEI